MQKTFFSRTTWSRPARVGSVRARRWISRSLLAMAVLASSAIVGCATSGSEGPKPQVQRGTKFSMSLPPRVLLMPPLCVTSDNACDDRTTAQLVNRVLKELADHGAGYIDGATMLDDARIRADADPQLRALALRLGAPTPVPPTAPSPYEQLTPADHAVLLKNAGATAIVAMRINIGPSQGLNQRVNTVVVRMVQGDSADLLWSSQCTSPSAVIPTLPQSLEVATDCALNGVFHPEQASGPASATAKPAATTPYNPRR